MMHVTPRSACGLRSACFAAVLAALALWSVERPAAQAPPPAASDRPMPDVETVLKSVRANLLQDPVREANYTYLETRRRFRRTPGAEPEVVSEEVYEVSPDELPGQIYRRLVRRGGRPLAASELARQDEERRRELARRAKERPADRARRIRQHAEKQRENRAELEEALQAWNITFVGRETYEGRAVIKARLEPRPQFRARTRVGGYLRNVAGYAWITEGDYHVVRGELVVRRPISIGWGIVGRVHEGGRASLRRALVDGRDWMLTLASLEASGRAFLVKGVKVDVVYEYSGFQRIAGPGTHTAAPSGAH